MKKLLYILYPLVMLAMAVATFVEKDKGTQYVADHIYGSWWFIALWALLTAAGVAWMVRQRMKRPSLVMLHASFVVILLGALVTHFTRWQGYVSLRECGTANEVVVVDGRHEGSTLRLPFTLKLDTFRVMNHEGTDAAYDYVSTLTTTDNNGERHYEISMNQTATVHHITILQSSYGGTGLDARTTFLFSYDPWGTTITYVGYACLLVALLLMLADPKGGFRRLLQSPLLRSASIALLLFCVSPAMASEHKPSTLPKEEAHELGQLLMLYNGRICPVETYAQDFTRKIYGKSSYKGLNAEQVLSGWLLWPDEWCNEPFVKVGGTLASTLMISRHASVNTFFNDLMGGYILGPYVEESYSKNADKFHRDVAAVDERLQLIMNLRHGSSLKIFPIKKASSAIWLAPADQWPANTEQGYALFAQQLPTMLSLDAQSGDWAAFHELTGKISKLQLRDGGTSLPSSLQISAEHLYNKMPFNTILFIVNLTMGFVLLIVSMRRIGRTTGKSAAPGPKPWLRWAPVGVMVLSWLALTFFSSLRWIIRGTVPMANGFETMLFVAWIVMLLSLICVRRMRIVLAFGFIMSGFFLLVSHISQMDPQITPVMPVLNSRWLTFHVSVIMFSFAMLSLTFICGLTAIFVHLQAKHSRKTDRSSAASAVDAYTALSRLLLYPAIATLATGIFLGAVWAGQSWGQYWSWDPKETWALITMMVYAVPLHTGSVEKLRRPVAYHVYMVVAFLAILMTYFGVNFFLGGLHSYA